MLLAKSSAFWMLGDRFDVGYDLAHGHVVGYKCSARRRYTHAYATTVVEISRHNFLSNPTLCQTALRKEYLLTQGQECREAVLLCKGTVNIVANGVQAGEALIFKGPPVVCCSAVDLQIMQTQRYCEGASS